MVDVEKSARQTAASREQVDQGQACHAGNLARRPDSPVDPGRGRWRGVARSHRRPAPKEERSLSADRPTPSSAGVSARMSRARRRDTAPEMLIRREAHRRGLRYRVDAPLPGLPRRRADLVFPRSRVAVFVDGCFWHSCPEHVSIPRANREWWVRKLDTNRMRDRQTDAHLEALGWTVLRFWEHEDPDEAVDRLEKVVRDRQGRPGPSAPGP
ncbi:very short patch repair endonuclease [Actinomycetospora sp. C-140]